MLATRIGGGAVLLLLASVALAQEDTTPTRLEPVERVQTPVIALGLDPAESWVGANLAYEEARYGEAIERYRQLIAEGFDSGQLHYNLGNAFLRSGDLGRAIASYRRAQRRRPRDEDLRANLAFARKSAKDAIQPPEPSRVLSTLFFWHFGMSPAELAVAAAILSLLFWGCLALRVRWRNSETLRWIAMSLAIPLLITCSSVLIRWTRGCGRTRPCLCGG